MWGNVCSTSMWNLVNVWLSWERNQDWRSLDNFKNLGRNSKMLQGEKKKKKKTKTKRLSHWLWVNWLILAKPLISLWLRKVSWDRDHHEASAGWAPSHFPSQGKAGFMSSFQCTPLGHPDPTDHTFAVVGLGDWWPSPTKQPVRATGLGHDVKFRGYSCTDVLHFSLGTTVSKTLQYSDEGPAKGQSEIRLHIWANICEQFPPLFSQLHVWPAQPGEAWALVKSFWGLQWLKELPESNS